MLCLWSAKGGVGCSVVAAAVGLLQSRREPVLLVDLGGDLHCVLGVPAAGTGIAEWLEADNPPPQALARIEIPVTDGLSLLPWSSATSPATSPAASGSPGIPAPSSESTPGSQHPVSERGGVRAVADRFEIMARSLDADERLVVVDVGLRRGNHPGNQVLSLASRSVLVTRACYLALRAARRWDRPDAVVVVDEVGRSLRHRDIATAVGAEVEASVRWDPAVARSVDAGLMASRLPRPLRALEGMAR